MRHLLTVWLPGSIVAATLLVSVMVGRPDSGVELRALAGTQPVDIAVRARRLGSRETVAGRRTGVDGRLRLLLAPGRYVIRGVRRGAPPRTAETFVREGRFVRVTLRFAARPPRERG